MYVLHYAIYIIHLFSFIDSFWCSCFELFIPPEQKIPGRRSSERNLVIVSVSRLMTDGEQAFAIRALWLWNKAGVSTIL